MKFTGMAAASVTLAGCEELAMQSQSSGERPNIIFIMTDDHASHAMSCYGSRINKTPNLDRIAEDGMLFKNCFCTNSICAPSRAVILTGKYSHLNGLIDNKVSFDGSQQTFPKILQKAGYDTAMIGKWHLKSSPTGFDYWAVLPGQGRYYDPEFIEMGEKKVFKGYVTDVITDKTIDWLENGRDKKKPFCLVSQHKAPHSNWQPGPKHKDMYKDVDIPEPETFNDDYSTRSEAARDNEMTIERHLDLQYGKGDMRMTPPKELKGQAIKKWKYQQYIKDYLRCVASVDDNVGRLLDYLDKAGLSENTVVIYTSDQGFYLGDHGWYDKRFMYEESLRMPLLVRFPKEIPAGSVSDAMVLNLDFAQTVLDYAGTAEPVDMQGESIRPLLQGNRPPDWRKEMYYHYYEYPGWHMVKRHYGIRTERYKLMHFYYDIDAWELYDLKNDPHELNNVYADPKHTGIVKELKKKLKRLQKQYGDSDELARKLLEKYPEGDVRVK
jgi:arylsulfatase A-like enzyme